MVSVLIIGDVRVYRDGLQLALTHYPQFDRVEGTACPSEALELLRRRALDVVLVDLAMTDGIDTIHAVRGVRPSATIVALAVPDAEDKILACAEAGAAAYVTRDGSVVELLDTIAGAVRGELRCPPRVAATLFRRLSELSRRHHGMPNTATALSSREIQVLGLLERGHSNKQIARELGIQVATAKNHVHRILAKLNVRRRGEAAAAARRIGGQWAAGR